MHRTVKRALASTGLLPAVRRVRRRLWLATDPGLAERTRHYRDGFDEFRRRNEPVLSGVTAALGAAGRKTALVAGARSPTLEAELALITALRMAGCRPAVLLDDQWRMLRPYYELAGIQDVVLWSDYDTHPADTPDARELVDRCRSLEDVVAIAHAGARVGLAAMNTALRRLRVGSLDPTVAGDRAVIEQHLTTSLTAAALAGRVLDATRPDVSLFWDTEYSPTAELFNRCIDRGVDTIAYRTAHRTNGLTFKRYRASNRDEQISSLSERTWAGLKTMPWSPAYSAELDLEIAAAYRRGDWFKECWTQAAAAPVDPAAVRAQLGLDPSKKTAVVFSHIVWDAPLSWAAPIFSTYEEWLVRTVRAACANDRVNWIVKIHPANTGKAARDGYCEEAAEVRAIRRDVGELPPHVVLLSPDTPLNAPSIFGVMDYCLTVRGTVGVEAARLGVPVLTGARARYSHRGFTVDSDSPAVYLARLAGIQDLPRLDATARELAERFAYGLFVGRTFEFTSVAWDYGKPGARPRGEILARSAAEWLASPDMRTLAHWCGDSRDEDLNSDAR